MDRHEEFTLANVMFMTGILTFVLSGIYVSVADSQTTDVIAAIFQVIGFVLFLVGIWLYYRHLSKDKRDNKNQ